MVTSVLRRKGVFAQRHAEEGPVKTRGGDALHSTGEAETN